LGKAKTVVVVAVARVVVVAIGNTAVLGVVVPATAAQNTVRAFIIPNTPNRFP